MTTLLVSRASELCIPEEQGTGVERKPEHAFLIEDGTITWIGPESEAPASDHVYDARFGAVLPALVDCHTHLIWGGNRIADYASRSEGKTYREIAAQGGGILTTVHATRAEQDYVLLGDLRRRLRQRLRYGIGTTEIKSGYGLSIEQELRLLELINRVREEGWDIESTCLAAHTLPPDLSKEEYVQQIIRVIIPECAKHKLARFVDVFIEQGAYSIDEARDIVAAAKVHGLRARLHVDQLSSGGGAKLAAELRAISADHLERTTDDDMKAMHDAGVIATLLPAAAVFLGDNVRGLGKRCIQAGVEVAVATDANPGSSPMLNLPLAATLSTTLMGLTVEQALRAITLGAAHSLDRHDIGTLKVGAKGRFIVLDHADSRALLYAYGEPIIRDTVLDPMAIALQTNSQLA